MRKLALFARLAAGAALCIFGLWHMGVLPPLQGTVSHAVDCAACILITAAVGITVCLPFLIRNDTLLVAGLRTACYAFGAGVILLAAAQWMDGDGSVFSGILYAAGAIFGVLVSILGYCSPKLFHC